MPNPTQGARHWPNSMWQSFTASIRENGWTWLAGLITALILLPIRDCAAPTLPTVTNAYVLTADDHPLGGGLVQNGVGSSARIDDSGKFHPLNGWRSSSTLMIYGPRGANGRRRYLGEYSLRRRESGEWEPIRLHQKLAETEHATSE